MISDLKQGIDLVSIVETAGVELQRAGSRYVGRCPFHNEERPSFYVFDNNRFYCFGCHERGDVIDFVRSRYELSFKDALKHLGIERGSATQKVPADIKKRKRRAELIKYFRKWTGRYGAYLGTMINKTERLMKNIPPEDLDLYAPLLHGLPLWEYHSDILIHGTDELKFDLFKDVMT